MITCCARHPLGLLLLLILNLKYNLFFLATGVKWCGSLRLTPLVVYLNVTISLLMCFLGLFHFLLGLFSFISLITFILSHTMPESDWEVQERVKEVFGFTPCLWQIHVVHIIQWLRDYYCQDWLCEIYDLLDTCSLHQIWNFCHCHSLKAVRVTVLHYGC